MNTKQWLPILFPTFYIGRDVVTTDMQPERCNSNVSKQALNATIAFVECTIFSQDCNVIVNVRHLGCQT